MTEQPASAPPDPYDPAALEARWKDRFRALDKHTPAHPALPTGSAPRTCIVCVSPSPAGQLHMRQVRVYTFADTLARFRRSRGEAVLFSIGFDAFTVFTEMAATRANIDPRRLSARSQKQIRAQLDRLGFTFDWSRSFVTCDEEAYRWSQWLFLKLYERGLVYRMDAPMDFCDSCEAALSAVQITDGRCFRCDTPARKVDRPQWFVRMGPYLADLEKGLDALTGWDVEQKLQRALFGKSVGGEVDLTLADGQSLTAFTPHPDAVGGAAFVAIAPDHPAISASCSPAVREAVRAADTAVEWRAERLPVIDTGLRASLNGSPRLLPVVVSATVSHRVGAGAMLGIPALDATDAILAGKLNLEIPGAAAAPDEAEVRSAVRFRVRDFPISREHFWGAPIPIIHCPSCGSVKVPEAALPVVLPRDLMPAEKGNPLARHPSFAACACPRCGGEARRDTGTLDGHTDSFWYWITPCVPPAERSTSLFDHPEIGQWLPAEQLIWTEGMSDGLMDIRFITRVLRDLGFLSSMKEGEPFRKVLVTGALDIDETKAQKSIGDVTDPGELLRRFGADALRFSLLHAVSPTKPLTWTGATLVPSHRFLRDVWDFTVARLNELRFGDPPDTTPPDRRGQKLRAWCDTALTKVTENLEGMEFQRATRNVMMLFERIQQFDGEARKGRPALPEPARKALTAAMATLLHMLAPMAPYLAEELWARGGADRLGSASPGAGMLAEARWPSPSSPAEGSPPPRDD